MTFNKLVVGTAVFILVLVVSLKGATAATVEECVFQANIATKVGELRDAGVSQFVVIEGLVNSFDFSYDEAYQVTSGLFGLTFLSPTEMGNGVFNLCTGEAS